MSEAVRLKYIQAMAYMNQEYFGRAEQCYSAAIKLTSVPCGELYAGRAKARFNQFNHYEALLDLDMVDKTNGGCSLEEMVGL